MISQLTERVVGVASAATRICCKQVVGCCCCRELNALPFISAPTPCTSARGVDSDINDRRAGNGARIGVGGAPVWNGVAGELESFVVVVVSVVKQR